MGMKLLRRFNLSSITDTYFTILDHMINTAGVYKNPTGTAHPSRPPGFTIGYGGVRVAFQYSCLCCVFFIVLSSFCVLYTNAACVSRLNIIDFSFGFL